MKKIIISLMLASLVLTLVPAPTASASGSSDNYVFVTKWGSLGSGDGQFDKAVGVAVDPSGNVYVADTHNHRIQKFDPAGGFLTKWGSSGSGDGQFFQPYSVAVDSGGDVYVADTHNHRIQKFDSSGGFLAKWGSSGSGDGQFSYPHSVAVDSSGNVYVADTHNHRIQKFNSTGGFLAKWGSSGSGDGQFSYPTGVAVDSTSGNVYVADFGNRRIQKFDSTGGFITKWGSAGSGDSQFQGPQGVAVDSGGNVYVADLANHRIQKFDSDGNFITKWGSAGSGEGEFNYPTGVAVDSSGNVYVADYFNHRIQKFAPETPCSMSEFKIDYAKIQLKDTGKCGGIERIVLEYTGTGADVEVEVFLKGDLLATFTGVNTGDTLEILATPETGGKLHPEIRLKIDGAEVAAIHTSCSKPIDVGDVHGDFVIDELDKLPPKSKGNRVFVKGKLELDPTCDGVDISEDVTVTVGPLSETIKMVEKETKKGIKWWWYKRPKGGPGNIKYMSIYWKKGRFFIRMDRGDLTGLTNPVTISIQIGDEHGEETILMTEKKFFWKYKAH